MRPRIAALAALFSLAASSAWAALPVPKVSVGIDQVSNPGDISNVIQIFLVMTVLSFAPSILVMATSFTRIVVVLGFVRSAIGTQSAPSNQIVIGLSLFLTLFVMNPVLTEIKKNAYEPYQQKRISQLQALEAGSVPLKRFMLEQVREKDIELFIQVSGAPRPRTPADVSMVVLMPAFMVSELRTAFQIGFLVYIPFLVIDMVVASVLMSMGMMMLPPVMISLPFKILLFVLVDGWGLVITSLVKSFAPRG